MATGPSTLNSLIDSCYEFISGKSSPPGDTEKSSGDPTLTNGSGNPSANDTIKPNERTTNRWEHLTKDDQAKFRRVKHSFGYGSKHHKTISRIEDNEILHSRENQSDLYDLEVELHDKSNGRVRTTGDLASAQEFTDIKDIVSKKYRSRLSRMGDLVNLLTAPPPISISVSIGNGSNA